MDYYAGGGIAGPLTRKKGIYAAMRADTETLELKGT